MPPTAGKNVNRLAVVITQVMIVVVLMTTLLRQVIHFICATRESHSGELVLVVRPNGELSTDCAGHASVFSDVAPASHVERVVHAFVGVLT